MSLSMCPQSCKFFLQLGRIIFIYVTGNREKSIDDGFVRKRENEKS